MANPPPGAGAEDSRPPAEGAEPRTFDDLPDDILHVILGGLLDPVDPGRYGFARFPPAGPHRTLRDVCRRWRRVADWARLASADVWLDASELADVDDVKVKYPGAVKGLLLYGSGDLTDDDTDHVHTDVVPRALASMVGGHPDLRRSLTKLKLDLCCSPLLPRVVPLIATCSGLTELQVAFDTHRGDVTRSVPPTVLAPLSALTQLESLILSDQRSLPALTPADASLKAWPALTDVRRLARLTIWRYSNFVPVGSDAALGRLHNLCLRHPAATEEALAAEDPFLLRAALDDGTWQPGRLTGLQELFVELRHSGRVLPPLRPLNTTSVGAEWEPLRRK